MEEEYIIGDLRTLRIKVKKDPGNNSFYEYQIRKIVKEVKKKCTLLLEDNNFVEKETEEKKKRSCLYRLKKPYRLEKPYLYKCSCKLNEINFDWFKVPDLVCIIPNIDSNKIVCCKKDNIYLIKSNNVDISLLKAANYFSKNILISVENMETMEKIASFFVNIFTYGDNKLMFKKLKKSKNFIHIRKNCFDENTKFNNIAVSFL
jgi:hypothetical protein